MLQENTIFWLVIVILAAAFINKGLNIYKSIKEQASLKGKYGKLKQEFNKLASNKAPNLTNNPANLNLMPDLTTMTLDQAAEMLGVSDEDLNNPIMRPVYEKIFQQLKERQRAPNTQQDNFNDWAH